MGTLTPNCKFIANYMEMIKSVYPIIRYIAAVCVVTGMVACTSSPGGETDPELNEYPIAFQSPQMESRGAVDDVQEMSDFRVWGWRTPKNESPVPVFEGEKVSAGSWTYEGGTRYWVMDQTYNFYAVHPVFPLEGNETTVNVTPDGTFTINNFDCSKTGDEAVDLMTASAKGLIYKTGETPQKVGLTFQHELAKVNIKATVEGGNAIVTKITFSGMKTGGNYKYNSASTDRWSDTKSGSFINETRQPLDTKGVDLLGDMLLIPQNVNNDIKLKVEYILDGVQQTPKEFTLPATVEKWEAGKSYRYTITFKGNNIVFTVNVASWNHSTGGIITVE